MSDQEREAFENELLRTPDLVSTVDDIEDEITADYAKGRLTSEQRLLCERYFLDDSRRNDAELIASIIQAPLTAAPAVQERRPALWPLTWLPLTIAATVSLMIGVTAGRIVWPTSDGPHYVTINSEITRAGLSGATVVSLSTGRDTLRMSIRLPQVARGPAYRLVVQKVDRSEPVWLQDIPDSNSFPDVKLEVAKAVLTAGTYFITVFSLPPNNSEPLLETAFIIR